MALSTRLADNAQNAGVDAVAALLNSGYLRIYSGSQPADPDSGPGGDTLLAELTFASTAFGAGSAGVATANAITADSSANASGNAGYFLAYKSNGTTPVLSGTVSTSGANLNLNSIAIQSGVEVSVSSFTLTLPLQGA